MVKQEYNHSTNPALLNALEQAHLLRDLRALSDADPHGQLWATAMADTLTGAHRAATAARNAGADHLGPQTLATLLNHYLGALAKGRTDNLADAFSRRRHHLSAQLVGNHRRPDRRGRALLRRFGHLFP